MASAIQTALRDTNLSQIEYSEKDAIGALYNELSKGIQSIKDGNVYTIEEAWKEIDKI